MLVIVATVSAALGDVDPAAISTDEGMLQVGVLVAPLGLVVTAQVRFTSPVKPLLGVAVTFDVLPVVGINVYDVMRRKTLVLTKAAIDALEARFK